MNAIVHLVYRTVSFYGSFFAAIYFLEYVYVSPYHASSDQESRTCANSDWKCLLFKEFSATAVEDFIVMGILFVGFYVVYCVLIVSVSNFTIRYWRKLENTPEDRVRQKYEAAVYTRNNYGRVRRMFDLPSMIECWLLKRRMRFYWIRSRFLQTLFLPTSYDFASYLRASLLLDVAKVLEPDWSTWLVILFQIELFKVISIFTTDGPALLPFQYLNFVAACLIYLTIKWISRKVRKDGYLTLNPSTVDASLRSMYQGSSNPAGNSDDYSYSSSAVHTSDNGVPLLSAEIGMLSSHPDNLMMEGASSADPTAAAPRSQKEKTSRCFDAFSWQSILRCIPEDRSPNKQRALFPLHSPEAFLWGVQMVLSNTLFFLAFYAPLAYRNLNCIWFSPFLLVAALPAPLVMLILVCLVLPDFSLVTSVGLLCRHQLVLEGLARRSSRSMEGIFSANQASNFNAPDYDGHHMISDMLPSSTPTPSFLGKSSSRIGS